MENRWRFSALPKITLNRLGLELSLLEEAGDRHDSQGDGVGAKKAAPPPDLQGDSW